MNTSRLIVIAFALSILSACKKDNLTAFQANNNIVPANFLAASHYDKLIVEIQYASGFEPSATTVSNLKSFLEQGLNKPAGITIIQKAITVPQLNAYSVAAIEEIEKANRTQNTDGSTLTAYFFFADKDYAGNPPNGKVLGIAYGASSMALFEKTIRDHSGGIGQPSTTTVETTVIEHEFGHILGLVNNGTAMQANHQDIANGRHCNNEDCLMYYAVETSGFIANLLGGNIPVLDANCLADLKANGGK